MLTYKHLLPKGIVGRRDTEINLMRKRKKSKTGRKSGNEASVITPGIEYAKALGLSGAPIATTGPDEVTKQFLVESKFLPRKAQGLGEREFPLCSQISFPEGLSTIRISRSATLGLGGLNYSPLKLSRVYGRTDSIPVLNLTGIHRSHVVYVASNVVVFFDYYNNHQSILQGHKNKITCMVKDRDNKYLASGDVGKESLVIIWDIRTGYPFKRIPASFEDYGVDSIGFVGSEDYVGTIGMERVKIDESVTIQSTSQRKQSVTEERQVVKVWFFGTITMKNKKKHGHRIHHGKPVVSVVIPASVDKQKEIIFSDETPEYFLTCGEKSLVFYTWIRSEARIIYHIPKTPKKFMGRMKGFSKSIWVTGDRCFTCTLAGYVLEFGVITPLGLQEPPNPNHNIKEYRRSYKIGDIPLSYITAYKEFFVIGDHHGNVQFFDEKFRIVRWTKTVYTHPINSISFNITDDQPEWKVEMQSHYEAITGERIHAQQDGISAVRDYTCGGHKYTQPSQTTIEKPPLFAADLVVGFAGGNTYYYHLGEGKVDQLVHGSFGQIVALDTCPFTTHLTVSNKKGEIQMYDYITQALLYTGPLFKKKLTITYLKFHPSGSFAFFGTSLGHLYFRRSYTWRSMDSPLEFGQSSIEKIVFSSCGVYVAHYDVLYTVTLYFFHTRRLIWLPKGKYRTHCRPIVDLAFLKDPTSGVQRLFSLGHDRRFIEYDVDKSNQADGLSILNIAYVDQCSIPTSMVFEYPWPQHGPMAMIANNINKIKMFDQNIRKTRRTVQGPNYGTPINRMISIVPEASTGRNTTFILMLLGNKIGLMKTPIDGNPFKFMAVLGHGNDHNITEAVIGCNGREVFTCAENDNCVFMWNPNIPALETCVLSGGSGVRPFVQMLDAGLPPDKSIAEDIENIFYHMMLKRSTTQQSMLNMNLTILLPDIPAVMRTCGFYPSEYEISVILEEAEFMGGMKLGEKPKEISLEDFIVLFANHRTFPVSDVEVIRAFQLLGMLNEDDEVTIAGDEFVNLLTMKGETFNLLDLPSFLPTFYRSKQDVADEDQQPIWLKKRQERHTSVASTLDTQTVSRTDGSQSQVTITDVKHPPGSPRPDGSPVRGNAVTFQKPGVNPNVAILNLTPSMNSLLQSEDGNSSEGPFLSSSTSSFASNQEIPEEISANFFIQELLTDESRDTINWKQAKEDEEEHLNKVHEMTKDIDSWEVILNRWKGRDEWRYFNRIFDQFRRDHVSMEKKLEMAIEMDHYCRTGSWPLPREPKAEVEVEEEGEGDELYGERREEEGELTGHEVSTPEDNSGEKSSPESGKKSAESPGSGGSTAGESKKSGSKKTKKVYRGEEGGEEEEGEGYQSSSSSEDEVPAEKPPLAKPISWLNFTPAESVMGEYADEEFEEDTASPPFSNLPLTGASPDEYGFDTELHTDDAGEEE